MRQCYRTMEYRIRVNKKHKWSAYEKRIISITVQTFIKGKVRILDMVVDRNGTEQTVWKVPAPFCATKYVNDARYLVEVRHLVEDGKFLPP